MNNKLRKDESHPLVIELKERLGTRRKKGDPKNITMEEFRQLYDYDSENGRLVVKVQRRGGYKKGKFASSNNTKNYRQIGFFGHCIREHRAIWFWHHGEWPSEVVDHIDGDIHNNKIENLRDVSNTTNVRKGNPGKIKGIWLNKKNNKYIVYIHVNNKRKHLGVCDSYEEAVRMRIRGEEKYWDEVCTKI